MRVAIREFSIQRERNPGDGGRLRHVEMSESGHYLTARSFRGKAAFTCRQLAGKPAERPLFPLCPT